MTTATREHVLEIELPATPGQVFGLLVTPSSICDWWFASQAIVVPQTGGSWAATWGDDEDEPDYVSTATIEVYDPPRRIVLSNFRYLAKDGPLPFEADFRTEFSVRPQGDHAILRVVQAGFPTDPVADDFYAGCEKGWQDTFASIERFVKERTA